MCDATRARGVSTWASCRPRTNSVPGWKGLSSSAVAVLVLCSAVRRCEASGCVSHSAGVQGCSQSVAGQPSAAAIRAYIVAPSIDSRRMSACPAWRAVSSYEVQQHPTHRPRLDIRGEPRYPLGGRGRLGSSWGSPGRRPRCRARRWHRRLRRPRASRWGGGGTLRRHARLSSCREAWRWRTRSIQPRSIAATCLMSPPRLRALAAGVNRACASVSP